MHVAFNGNKMYSGYICRCCAQRVKLLEVTFSHREYREYCVCNYNYSDYDQSNDFFGLCSKTSCTALSLNTCCQLAGMLICSTFCVLQLSVPSQNVMWSWLSSYFKQPFNLTVYMQMSYFALCCLLDCHHICLYTPASLN